ncbi:GumC family protein [Oceanihabitans sediminis]|uniref:GumC family protein n=1 Tax=Oceanihabitans sediminis TaxID=1812012 RepID=UPI003A92D4CC
MNHQIEIDSENEHIDIKGILFRYLAYWPWILTTVLIALVLAFYYLRYTPNSYNTTAKVKVLTDKEATDFALDLDKMLGKSNVNLENERAVLSSYRLNKQVVEQLNLQVQYFQTGRIKESQVYHTPFRLSYMPEVDSTKVSLEYEITIRDRGYRLRHIETEKTLEVPNFYFETPTAAFPFTVVPREPGTIVPGENPVYTVRIKSEERATQDLLKAITISPDGKNSDILILSLDATNKDRAQDILNTLIEVYTEDGILDRQEISKRTIAFIDERFAFLSTELDSIEVSKGVFKQDNNLSVFEADAASAIEKRAVKDEQLFEMETQLLLAGVLEESIGDAEDFQLLPANIGLNSGAINNLVKDYNEALLEYQKWRASAGDNNPKVKILKQTIVDLNANIDSSIKGYKTQLNQSLRKNQRAQSQALQSFKKLPKQEKILRSIERQQLLKENLYLLLLQKREEAAIKMAVTSANVKVIDYAITNAIPVAPKRKIIYLGALLMGLVLPVGVLYLKFLTDNKIYISKDVEAINPKTPILVEVPSITNAKEAMHNAEQNPQTREAFRTLGHNLKFMLAEEVIDGGKVVCITSSVKGEGKSTVSFNLAQTYFELNKKVLLVGADLRNPQLHPYINESRDTPGLSNYLVDEDLHWQDLLFHVDKGTNRFDILLSGEIPPMPSVLLSSQRFKDFIQEARKHYDYVLIDSAPTLLVADTLTFVHETDFTVYVVRSGKTEKQLIEFSKKMIEEKKMNQMAYVINDMQYNGINGYNYGYGYGYHADMKKKAWYQFWK